jgi:hypothetical protein
MRTRTVMSAFALAATVLAVAGTAACGRASAGTGIASAGGARSASAHPTASVDPQEQSRAFTQCLREHGVDVPDPDAGAGGGPGRVVISGGPDAADAAALEACKDKLPNGGDPPSMSPEQLDQLRAFAQCMREHGVDVPDPEPGGNGIMISRSGGPGPDDPTVKAAQEACHGKLPGAITEQHGDSGSDDSGGGTAGGAGTGGTTGGGQ